MPPVAQSNLLILKNKPILNGYNMLVLESAYPFNESKPGQFLNIRLTTKYFQYDPFLRRPFSIFSSSNKEIKIIYKIVGRGTKLLAEFKAGDRIDTIGPLGRGFTINNEYSNIYLIGGGIGIAPLFNLYSWINKKSHLGKSKRIKVFLGVKEKGLALWCKKLFGLKDFYISTEDGSYGYKGLVTQLVKEFISSLPDKEKSTLKYYAAGNYSMLKELVSLLNSYNLEGEVSLESRLLCGLGSCWGCVIPTVKGNKRVCKDGPIFAASEVLFQ
jgi:dihydroorotate dehydrogenase electron transfer subunit